MQPRVRRAFGWLALWVVVAGVLAGCGGRAPSLSPQTDDVTQILNFLELAGVDTSEVDLTDVDLASLDLMAVANILGVENVVEVADLMDLAAEYLAEYRTRYALRPLSGR